METTITNKRKITINRLLKLSYICKDEYVKEYLKNFCRKMIKSNVDKNEEFYLPLNIYDYTKLKEFINEDYLVLIESFGGQSSETDISNEYIPKESK